MDNSGDGHIRWNTSRRTITARERGGAAARSIGVADTLLNGETRVTNSYDEAQVLKDKLNATMRRK